MLVCPWRIHCFCKQGPFSAHLERRHQPLGYLHSQALFIFLGQRSPLGHRQHPLSPFLPLVCVIPQCPKGDQPPTVWTNKKSFAQESASVLKTGLLISFFSCFPPKLLSTDPEKSVTIAKSLADYLECLAFHTSRRKPILWDEYLSAFNFFFCIFFIDLMF